MISLTKNLWAQTYSTDSHFVNNIESRNQLINSHNMNNFLKLTQINWRIMTPLSTKNTLPQMITITTIITSISTTKLVIHQTVPEICQTSKMNWIIIIFSIILNNYKYARKLIKQQTLYNKKKIFHSNIQMLRQKNYNIN